MQIRPFYTLYLNLIYLSPMRNFPSFFLLWTTTLLTTYTIKRNRNQFSLPWQNCSLSMESKSVRSRILPCHICPPSPSWRRLVYEPNNMDCHYNVRLENIMDNHYILVILSFIEQISDGNSISFYRVLIGADNENDQFPILSNGAWTSLSLQTPLRKWNGF